MGEEKQLALSKEFEDSIETELVPVQERTIRIFKPFIRCATCARNLDQEAIVKGFYKKTFCNYYKKATPDQYSPDYNIELDRKTAQHCKYYLPEIGTLADLSYDKPFKIVEDMFPLEKKHAQELFTLFINNG